MFRRNARIIAEAQAEIERLRERVDELKADAETHQYNERRALRERAAAADDLMQLRREYQRLRDQNRALDERLALLQAVNEALDERLALLQAVNEALDVRVPAEAVA